MASAADLPRTALLVGATGLVGRALLPLLLGNPRYELVHVWVRRPLADIPPQPKLRVQVVDFANLLFYPRELPCVHGMRSPQISELL